MLKGGTGADIFSYLSTSETGDLTDVGAERIEDFSGLLGDTIKGFGVGGSVSEYSEKSVVSSQATDYAAALIEANAIFASGNGQSYYFTTFGNSQLTNSQGVLFINQNNDATEFFP